MPTGDRDRPAPRRDEHPDPYRAIAPFYDRTLAGFEEDVPLYEAFARRLDAPVLDLGVGTGRVAMALAHGQRRIVGIDRSAAMLALAVRALRRRQADRVDLVRGDLRALPLRGGFGLILCACDSFLHLPNAEAQLETLRACRRLLHPAGRLVLDLPGPAGDWGDWAPGARPLVLDWSEAGPGGRVSRFTTFRADAAAQTRDVTDIYEEIAADGSVKRVVAEYRLRFVFPAELRLLIVAAALRLDALYGSYELDGFDQYSGRMIAVAACDGV
ncbi:MAG TPA: class I SAM-dependent methyltransferase [Dehalococcoidia bacterium]|nr:class I SAM-dependent methyltransferase [Dehalococcoidia bacterium]